MYYICICQQSGNSNLFKGHRSDTLGKEEGDITQRCEVQNRELTQVKYRNFNYFPNGKILCGSAKFMHQEIRRIYVILCNVINLQSFCFLG